MKICIIKQLVDSFSSTRPAPCLMCSSVTGRGAERDDDWLPSSFRAPRGLKGADERSHAHTRRNVSDGGGVKTTGTVIDTAAKRESGVGRDGAKERGGIVCERRGGETSECVRACLISGKHVHLQSLWSVERETRQFHSSEDGGRRSAALAAWIG